MDGVHQTLDDRLRQGATDPFPLHRRQFVLGPGACEARADWRSIAIRDGLVLSYCPDLPVTQTHDRRGRAWVLLGLPVQTGPERGAPLQELAALAQHDPADDDLPSLTESWAGRWLLIGERGLDIDITSSFSCYYLEGGPWVSSSLALLSRIGGREEPGSRRHRLVKGDGFHYDPPPRTCYAGIAKLLPSQSLDLESGRPVPRRVLALPASPPPYEEALDRLAACLTSALRNAAGPDRRLQIALSAGYHSRVLLAAAAKAGVAFETYTQSYPLMLRADRELPPKLAQAVGARHVLHRPKAERADLRAQLDAHCHGLFMEADRDFYSRQQWAWTEAGDLFVRGRGFEICECFEWWRLPPEPSLQAVLAGFGAEQAPAYVRRSVADYLDWSARHPLPDVDWRDRWYLDIRLGGWACGSDHALTLVEGTGFPTACSDRVFTLLLQLPLEKRRTRRHLVDLIDRLCPALNAFPYNPPDGALRDAARQARKVASLLRERGLAVAAYQVATALRRRLGLGGR